MTAELEALIASKRPTPEQEGRPASGGTLHHLNTHGLLAAALRREVERAGLNGDRTEHLRGATLTKLTVWEVMSEAQRRGVVFGTQS